MSKKDKTLGDTIRAAMEKAVGEQSSEKCGCMHCSGNVVRTEVFKSKLMLLSLAEGVGTDGEDELELTFSFPPADDDSVIRVVGDEAVDQFIENMRELFA